MCVAAPGRVVEVTGNKAKVDFSGNVLTLDVSLVDAEPGDWVLAHAGMAIEKLDPGRAEELALLFEEIGELSK